MIRIFFLIVFLGVAKFSFGQPGYTISIKEKKIEGFPSLQSFVFGTFSDEVLLIGGRVDGLHKKQPWRSFHPDGRNDSIYVWDNISNHLSAVSLTSLSSVLREQLSASNHEFYQHGDIMCMVGGYGYSSKTDDKMTFPAALFFKVSEIVAAVKKGALNDGLFRRIEDERFAVCGGQLEMMDGDWYLVGGHRFDGSYNPMGNPTYEQKYVSGYHVFSWNGEAVTWKNRYSNEDLLHRRDFNLLPSVDSLGAEHLTAISGVFQVGADIPYRTAVHMDGDTIFQVPAFQQFFNNYHSAHASLYEKGKVSHFFFGGISEYYLDDGELIQDTNCPFVKTVSVVQETENGLVEWTLPYEMPGFLGAGASFIPVTYLEHRGSGIIDVESLCMRDSVLIGYVVGGISSSMPNTFWPDEPSYAYDGVVEVYLKKVPGTYNSSRYSNSKCLPDVYTNSNMDEVHVTFELDFPCEVSFFLTSGPFDYVSPFRSVSGEARPAEEIIEGEGYEEQLMQGKHHFVMSFDQQIKGEHYFYLIVRYDEALGVKMLVE